MNHFDTGFMKAKVFMKNGERWSSDRIFENRNKKELSIITNAHVNRVRIFFSN